MGQKIAASAVLAIIGLTLVVFGVGFLGYALAAALAPSLGVAGGAAVAGGIFVGPPVLWAIVTLLVTQRPPAKPALSTAQNGLWTVLFAAIAKETPWIAIVGAGAVAAAEIFLASRRRK